LRIETQDGEVILPQTDPQPQQVVDPRIAYVITDILSDDQVRARAFGRDSNLNLPFPAAAKTGTTNDYRDSWIVGYTPELVTGVWVGNHDGRPMDKITGSQGAGSIWRPFMEQALANEPHASFARPAGLVEIEVCPISGLLPGPDCPQPVRELFLEENVPEEVCPVHVRERVCVISGDLAGEHCPEALTEERSFVDLGPSWDNWARNHGFEPPPRRTCSVHDRPTVVRLDGWNGAISGIVSIRGTADMPGFTCYRLDYGIGEDPKAWGRLTPEIQASVHDGVLARWDTQTLQNGIYSLRLVVRGSAGVEDYAVVNVRIQNATPTPRTSPTPSATATQQFPHGDADRRPITPVPTLTESALEQ